METEVIESDIHVEPVTKEMSMTENMGLVPEEPEGEPGMAPELGQEEYSGQAPSMAGSLSEQEMKGVLESLLYVSTEPLTLDKLTQVLAGPGKSEVQGALRSLQADYEAEGRGLQISELAGGFVMVTRPDCAPWISRLHKVKASAKVSRSAMETLAIIAYKQPIVRADIEQIRGVETSGVIRTLLEQKLIRMVGRKDVPGRPILYGTSKLFLQRFGLRDLKDLPPLRQFKELGQEGLPFFDEGDPVTLEANDDYEAEEVGKEESAEQEPISVQEAS